MHTLIPTPAKQASPSFRWSFVLLLLLASCGIEVSFETSPLCQADLQILSKTPQRLGCFFSPTLPTRWIVQYRQGRFFFCSSPAICDITQHSIPRSANNEEIFYIFFPPNKEISDASDLSSIDRACQDYLQQKSKVRCQTGQNPDDPEDACWILLRVSLQDSRSRATCDRLSSSPP